MIYLTIIAALQILVVLACARVYLTARREDRQAMEKEREDWRDERRELLTRIQRPELVPVKRTPIPVDQDAVERARQTRRELAAVGTVGPPSGDPVDLYGDDDEDGDPS